MHNYLHLLKGQSSWLVCKCSVKPHLQLGCPALLVFPERAP